MVWTALSEGAAGSQRATLVVKLFAATVRSTLPAQTAKTHEMMLHFHGKRQLASGQVRNVMLGFQKPVLPWRRLPGTAVAHRHSVGCWNLPPGC